MRWMVALLLTMGLAGCASGGSGDSDGAEGVDVQATKDTGVIRGVVLDAAVKPLAGALVTLSGTDKSTKTLDNGAFGFEGLEPGTYFVKVLMAGFEPTQTSVEVVAGVSDPAVTRIQMVANAVEAAYVESYSFSGYLECGVAVVATSVGCTMYGPLAELTASEAIWPVEFSVLPNWTQGELVWEHSQQAGGELIWEIVMNDENVNDAYGYRETTSSPALAYIDTAVLDEHAEAFLAHGVNYRFFGGPHPLCKPPQDPVPNFGCGATLEQRVQAVIHNFYNFAPTPGWRFTNDGAPTTPK